MPISTQEHRVDETVLTSVELFLNAPNETASHLSHNLFPFASALQNASVIRTTSSDEMYAPLNKLSKQSFTSIVIDCQANYVALDVRKTVSLLSFVRRSIR
jgi:hypothetical protein